MLFIAEYAPAKNMLLFRFSVYARGGDTLQKLHFPFLQSIINQTDNLFNQKAGVRMNDKTRYQILKQREMMMGYNASDIGAEPTDQTQKLPPLPPVKKETRTKTIKLPTDFEKTVRDHNLFRLISQRKSCRSYSDKALSLNELSFLLWASQGIRSFAGSKKEISFRNVPSAGSRHPLETYLFIQNVENIKSGIYHYLPHKHQLELWQDKPDFQKDLTEALCGQKFAGTAPVTFVWSAVPYRTEWRYGLKAHKYILIDAGHACENLYLACEAIGCGTCAIGAYDQELLDELLGFAPGPSSETDYEFSIYAASVGLSDRC